MRQQFIETDSRRKAVEKCPWAAKLIKVAGGYRAFEALADYETWRKQK